MLSVKHILNRYSASDTAIAIIGDILDRGTPQESQKCLDLLITEKLSTGNVYILQTNHLNFHHQRYSPAEWWYISPKNYQYYINLFDQFPYAVHTKNGVVAVHGLPPLGLIDQPNFEVGNPDWHTVNWARITDEYVDQTFIKKTLRSNRANVIIRSHDHFAPRYTFENKVLTFTTSRNIPDTRPTIAILDLEKPINNVTDIKLIDLEVEGAYATEHKGIVELEHC